MVCFSTSSSSRSECKHKSSSTRYIGLDAVQSTREREREREREAHRRTGHFYRGEIFARKIFRQRPKTLSVFNCPRRGVAYLCRRLPPGIRLRYFDGCQLRSATIPPCEVCCRGHGREIVSETEVSPSPGSLVERPPANMHVCMPALTASSDF